MYLFNTTLSRHPTYSECYLQIPKLDHYNKGSEITFLIGTNRILCTYSLIENLKKKLFLLPNFYYTIIIIILVKQRLN